MQVKNTPPIRIAEITIESIERPTLKIGVQNYLFNDGVLYFTADRYLLPDDAWLKYLASVESKVKCLLTGVERIEFGGYVIAAGIKRDELSRMHPWARIGNVKILSRQNTSEEELLRIKQFNDLSLALT